MIKQISVLIDNERGQAYRPVKVLGDAGIDVCAISVGDTADFGILRMITRDNDNAVAVLRKAGFTVNFTDLIGVAVENHPGGLAALLSVFEEESIDIEYFYSFLGEEAIMFFKVEEIEEALDKLKKHNVQLVEKI